MNKEIAVKIIKKYFINKDIPNFVIENLSLAMIKLSNENLYKDAAQELEEEFLNGDVLRSDLIDNIGGKIN